MVVGISTEKLCCDQRAYKAM